MITMRNQRTTIRTYSELITLPTFEERFAYLKLGGVVGEETFGFERYLNQKFYKSGLWRERRNDIIIRDMGRDLGIEGRDIYDKIIIHHMNPVMLDDILHQTEYLLNPEYLICVTKATHDAIHYGDASLLPSDPVVRTRNDTCPWKIH